MLLLWLISIRQTSRTIPLLNWIFKLISLMIINNCKKSDRSYIIIRRLNYSKGISQMLSHIDPLLVSVRITLIRADLRSAILLIECSILSILFKNQEPRSIMKGSKPCFASLFMIKIDQSSFINRSFLLNTGIK